VYGPRAQARSIGLTRVGGSLHLEGMREDGEAIPEPTVVAALTIAAV
jgi:hypothetical protein